MAATNRAEFSISAQEGEPTHPIYVGRAVDGPAHTLVVDLTGTDDRISQVELALCRRRAMLADPRIGAKTIGILSCAASALELLFLQGLGDFVDPAAEVCLNSAAVAVSVARERWSLIPDGEVTVHMGDLRFVLEQVA